MNSAYNFSNLDSSTQYEIINTIALHHTLTILQNHNLIFMNGTSEKARRCADSYAICASSVTTAAIAGFASCNKESKVDDLSKFFKFNKSKSF